MQDYSIYRMLVFRSSINALAKHPLRFIKFFLCHKIKIHTNDIIFSVLFYMVHNK